jgi:hypothetical protein
MGAEILHTGRQTEIPESSRRDIHQLGHTLRSDCSRWLIPKPRDYSAILTQNSVCTLGSVIRRHGENYQTGDLRHWHATGPPAIARSRRRVGGRRL